MKEIEAALVMLGCHQKWSERYKSPLEKMSERKLVVRIERNKKKQKIYIYTSLSIDDQSRTLPKTRINPFAKVLAISDS